MQEADGQPSLSRARHDATLALCFDEYLGIGRPGFNGREHLRKLLDRPVVSNAS